MRNPTPIPIISALAFWLVAIFMGSPAVLAAQSPPNNHCAGATLVEIPEAGFAMGVIFSDTFDISAADIEAGEFFSQDLVAAGNDKKSIWFRLDLPTTRSISIQLRQANNTFTPSDCGMILYQGIDCLPGSDRFMASTDNFGSIANTCLLAGGYLVQIGSKQFAAGGVYLEVTIGNTNAVYDTPADAHFLGELSGSNLSVTHAVGCQSIENAAEYECLVDDVPARFSQSSWYVFRTGAYQDLVHSEVLANGMSDVGYRLYAGDVRDTSASVTPLLCAIMHKNGSSIAYYDHVCMHEPNTVYSVQLLFPAGFTHSGMRLTIRARGTQLAGGPLPVLDSMAAANHLGVLMELTEPDARKKILRISEDEAAKKLYFGLGRWMSYNWNFDEGSRIAHYLRQKGLNYTEDMVRCMLILFHRKVAEKPLDEDVLIDSLVQQRKKLIEEERKARYQIISEEVIEKKQ